MTSRVAMDYQKQGQLTTRRGSKTSHGSQGKGSHGTDNLGRDIDVAGWASPRKSPRSQQRSHHRVPVRSFSEQPYGYDSLDVHLARRSQSISESGLNRDTVSVRSYS